jgi:phosphoglycolate phosphatase
MLVRRALTAAQGAPPDADLLAGALRAFTESYRQRLFVDTRLYAGVVETLELIRSNGLTVGCVTNKPEAFARELLKRADIGACFDFVHGGDSFATRKPSPEPLTRAAARFGVSPQQAVMVGDARNDLESARSAGFEFVFAAYGYAPPEDAELRNHQPAIAGFSALARLLCG